MNRRRAAEKNPPLGGGLVLTLNQGGNIRMTLENGDVITVTLVENRPGRSKVHIKAPQSVDILRGELVGRNVTAPIRAAQGAA